jgi:hypothetical protein
MSDRDSHVPRLESVGGNDDVDVDQPWIVTISGMEATLKARGVQHAGRFAYLIAAENGRMYPLAKPPSGDDERLMTRDQLRDALTGLAVEIGSIEITARGINDVPTYAKGTISWPTAVASHVLTRIDEMADGGDKPGPDRADADVIRTALGRCRDAIQYLSGEEQGRVLSSLNVDIRGVPVDDDGAVPESGAATPQSVIDTARDGMEDLPPAGRRQVVLTLADDVMRHRDQEDAGRYLIPSADAMAAAEVSAMAGVAEALAGLSEAEAGRVIAWARARFLYGTKVTR